MAELTDLSDIINRVTGGNSGTPETIFFHKDARVGAAAASATIAARYTSLWQYNGQPGSNASTPSAENPTNASAGSMFQTDPGGGRTKWMLGASACSSAAGTLTFYDRLWHGSGLSGTTTTAQTHAGVVSRYTSTESVGNQLWAEIYTQIGTSATTVTVSYIDQDGNGSTSVATAFGATGLREAQRIIPIPLASGDTGVREVVSVTVAATTGTAGNFGIVIARPLLTLPLGLAGCGAVRDLITGLPGILEIKTDACIAMHWFANSTGAPQVLGSLHFIEK